MIPKDQCTQIPKKRQNSKRGVQERKLDQLNESEFKKNMQDHAPNIVQDMNTSKIHAENSHEKHVTEDENFAAENTVAKEKVTKYTKVEEGKVLTSLFWTKNPLPNFNASNINKNVNSKAETFDITRYHILIFGGIDPFNSATSDYQGKTILQYNIKGNNWKGYTNMPGSRHHHSAIVYSGKIYIIGGTRPAYENILPIISKSVWSFDPHSMEWRNEKDLPYPRRDFGLVGTRNGIFVIGGEDDKRNFLSSTILLHPEKDADWIEVANLQMARTGLAAALIEDHIFAAGGILAQPQGCVTDAVESYSLSTGHWTVISNLRKPRSFAKCCVLSGPKVFIVGGVTLRGNRFVSLSSVDKLDVKTKEWQPESNMATARHGHDVIAFEDKILVFGGVSTINNTTLSTVECYSTTQSRWITGVQDLPSPLSGLAAVLFT